MAELSRGVEIRAQIDAETVKALILINGGGVIALLALLPNLLEKDGLQELARAVVYCILILLFGLAFAVGRNHFRRQCSLRYEQHNMSPPKGRFLGLETWAPGICCASTVFMSLSAFAFVLGGGYVAIIAVSSLNHIHLACLPV